MKSKISFAIALNRLVSISRIRVNVYKIVNVEALHNSI